MLGHSLAIGLGPDGREDEGKALLPCEARRIRRGGRAAEARRDLSNVAKADTQTLCKLAGLGGCLDVVG